MTVGICDGFSELFEQARNAMRDGAVMPLNLTWPPAFAHLDGNLSSSSCRSVPHVTSQFAEAIHNVLVSLLGVVAYLSIRRNYAVDCGFRFSQ
jgi:hypothetical protein